MSDTLESISFDSRSRGSRPVWLSKHALARSARRNVVPDAIEYVLAYGRMVQRTGVMFFFLGKRDIPPVDRKATWAARLAGTAVLLAGNGEVITLYRNQRALRAIRRKLKYRLTPEQCPSIRIGDDGVFLWDACMARDAG